MSRRKLTRAQRQAKAHRQAEFETVFIDGRQRRVRRPLLVDGMTVDETSAANADPIWLHQEGLWELIPFETPDSPEPTSSESDRDDVPF